MTKLRLKTCKIHPFILLNLNGNSDSSQASTSYWKEGRSELERLVGVADEIWLVSAYYGTRFLTALFSGDDVKHRKSKKVRILLGRAAPPALPQQRDELLEVRRQLVEAKYSSKNIHIRIAPEGRFFHTKLYRFKAGSKQTTLIGSANATDRGFGTNDELLVSLSGKQTSVDEYVEKTWRAAEDLDHIVAKPSRSVDSFEAMLREGLLYFQPPRQLAASIDCFPSQKYKLIAEKLKELGGALPFTEQSGVASVNCLRLLNIPLSENDEGRKGIKFQMPAYSIQTVFGFWVPAALEKALEERIAKSAAKRRSDLSNAGKRLRTIPRGMVEKQMETFFSAVDARLAVGKAPRLTSKQRSEVLGRIHEKIERLDKTFHNPRALDRLSRRFVGSAVPELWEDQRSTDDLMDSFCEYVSWRLDATGKKPDIVRVLADKFRLSRGDDGENVRQKIEEGFERGVKLTASSWT